MINSALRYRVQAPLIDQVLADIGIEGGSLAKLGGLIREARDMQRHQGSASRKGGARRSPTAAGRRAAGGADADAARARRAKSTPWPGSTSPASSMRRREASGRACATSMACRTGIPPSRESRIENGEPADKVGCVRDFRLRNGDRIREKLLGLSDYDMFCTYSILESPMGVENYVATLRLTPVTDGERTFIEWTAEFDCAPEREAELVGNIGTGVFQGGFDALKRAFGG